MKQTEQPVNKHAEPTGEITPMGEGDIAALLELMRIFYAHERFVFDAEKSGCMLHHLLANQNVGSVFLAREGERGLGYLVLTHCYSLEFGGPFVLLDEIFILPEAQGRGLGKQLIDTAVEYCRKNGFGYLRLEVQKKNTRAIEVYSTYGFRTEDRFLMSFAAYPDQKNGSSAPKGF